SMKLWQSRLRVSAPLVLPLAFLGLVLLMAADNRPAAETALSAELVGDSGGSTAVGPSSTPTRYVIHEAEFQETIEVFGTLAPQVTVSVSVETGGVVSEVHAEAGDVVEAGDLLAELQDERAEISLRQAEIGLHLSRQERELARMRLSDGERVVEAALLEIEQARLELKQRLSEHGEIEHRVYLVGELHKVGGSTDGEVRAAESELSSAATRLELAERRLAAVEIGYRAKDLLDAGIEVPADSTEYPRAFLRLHTRRLEHELSSAESRVDAAELELRRAELAYAAGLIRSPMNGVVGDRFLVPGERVAVGDRAFTVLSLNALEFVGELGEDKQYRLELGSAARIYTARSGEFIAHGTVTRAAPYLDPSRRSRALRVTLDTAPASASAAGAASGATPATATTSNQSESGRYRPGLLTRAVISTGPPRLHLRVSEEALHQGYSAGASSPAYLRILRGNELVTVPVSLLEVSNGYVLFEGDVQLGEQAVARIPGDSYVAR
ncbi:MAG: HlyD family efflux transporter periplasmic adaptor subunit, partial [Spirochaetaceae bacterium]